MSSRQDKWDGRYLGLAREIGSWSKDPSTKVGAVLVRSDNRIISTGFNGFEPGAPDAPELYADREFKYANVVHAEINAIFSLKTASARHEVSGSTLYTSFPCCPACMNVMKTFGVRRVVMPPLPRDGRLPEWIAQWTAWMDQSLGIAERGGIEVSIRHV